MTKTEEKQTTEQAQSTEPETDVLAGAPEVEFDESDRMGGTYGTGSKFFSICQQNTAEVEKLANIGKFVTKDDEGNFVFFDDLEVIMLESSPRATRFDDGAVACRSYDGKTGNDGQICKECKWNSFKENGIEKALKCKGSYVVLCVAADDPGAEPFFFQVTAGAIRLFKAYTSELQNRYRRPVFSVVTKISTASEKTKFNSIVYNPVFKPVKALTTEEVSAMRERRIAESHRFRPVEDTTTGTPVQHEDPEVAAVAEERDPFVSE